MSCTPSPVQFFLSQFPMLNGQCVYKDLTVAKLLIHAAATETAARDNGNVRGDGNKNIGREGDIKRTSPTTSTMASSVGAAESGQGVRRSASPFNPPQPLNPSRIPPRQWRTPPPSTQELRRLTAGTEIEERRTLAALRDIEACLEEGGVAAGYGRLSMDVEDAGGGGVQRKKEEPGGNDAATVASDGDSSAVPVALSAAAVAALPPKLAEALGLFRKEAGRHASREDQVEDERIARSVGNGGEDVSSCRNVRGGNSNSNGNGNNDGTGSSCRPPEREEYGDAGPSWYSSVDIVRQARSSVEFRVARRRHREEQEQIRNACGFTFNALAPAAVDRAEGAPLPAAAEGVLDDQANPFSSTTNLNTKADSGSATVVSSSRCAAVSTRISAWLANGGTVADLFHARVDRRIGSHEDEEVSKGGEKPGSPEAIARVLRENQAKADAARAEVSMPPRSRLLPARLRCKTVSSELASDTLKDDVGGDKVVPMKVAKAAAAATDAAVADDLGGASATATDVSSAVGALFDIHAARIRELKPLMTRAIRRRRLALRRRWEELGEEYARVSNMWQADVARWEEKMEEEDARETFAAVGVAGMGDGSGYGGIGGVGGADEGDSGPSMGLGRGERRGGRRLTDVVRSDYEEAEVVKKFEDKHREEERIRKGAVDVPTMLTAAERQQLPEYLDVSNARGTLDGLPARCAEFPPDKACPVGCNCPAVVEAERKRLNMWTDMEKCIFLDKFIQHPKNFMRISSFLPRKSPEDVVQFYYDSKTSIDYKGLLKEAVNRSKVCSTHFGKFPGDINYASSSHNEIETRG